MAYISTDINKQINSLLYRLKEENLDVSFGQKLVEVLKQIPGVEKCNICLKHLKVTVGDILDEVCANCKIKYSKEPIKEQCQLNSKIDFLRFYIDSKKINYGYILLSVNENFNDEYNRQIEYLCFITALNIENEIYDKNDIYRQDIEIISDFLNDEVKKKSKNLYEKVLNLKKEIEKINNIVDYEEQRYKLIFDNSPLGIINFKNDGSIIECNERFAEIIGAPVEAIMKFNLLDIPDKKIVNAVGQAIQGKVSYYEDEYESITTKKVTPIKSFFAPITKDEQIVGGIGIVEDNTEKKKLESNLFDSLQKWQKSFDAMNDSIIIINKDSIILDANKQTEIFFKKSKAEIIGQKCFKVFHNTDNSYENCQYQKSLNSRTREKSIINLFDKIIEITVDPIFNAENQIIAFIHILKDITEQKLQEEKIQKNEEFYRKFIEDNEAVILFVNPKTMFFTYANKAAEKFYGWTIEQMQKMKVTDVNVLSPEEIRQKMDEAKKLSTNYFNFRHRLASGEIKDVEVYQTTLNFSTGTSFAIIVHDISNRLEAEKKVNENEEYINTILQTTIDGFFIVDITGKYTEVNDAYCKMLGYECQELLAFYINDIDASENKVETQKRMNTIYEKGYDKFETKLRKKSGEIIDVEMSVTFLKLRNGTFISFCRDISDRKKLENILINQNLEYESINEELRQTNEELYNSKKIIEDNEKKYRSLFENDLTGDFISKPDGSIILVNQSFINILGYDLLQEVLQKNMLDFYKNAEDRKFLIERLKNEKKIEFLELQFVKKNGEIIYVIQNLVGMFDEEDELVQIQGYMLDMTERHYYEIELIVAKELAELNEKKYRSLFENDLTGDFVSLPGGEIILANQAFVNIFGFNSIQEVMETNFGDLYQNKKDREKLLSEINILKKLDNYEINYVRRDGVKISVIENVVGQFDEKGNLLQMQGYIFDITEIKKYEQELINAKIKAEKSEIDLKIANKEYESINEELRETNEELNKSRELIIESERKLRLIFENAPVGIINYDETGKIISCNDTFVKIIGTGYEQLIGLNMMNLPDKKLAAALNMSLNGNFGYYNDDYHSVKVEKITPVKIIFAPIFSLNEQLIGGVGIVEDVTEQKRFEKELKTQNEEYESVNEELRETNEELKLSKEKAEESEQLKTAFLQNMSHEIRTPMNAIIGFSEFLKDKNLTQEKRENFVNIVINSSRQLLSIVNDILTISAIDTKQEKVNISNVNINDLLSELNVIFKPQANNKNISMFLKTSLEDSQSEVYTDKTKITQIITNLLTNALKFTHEGAIEFGYSLKENYLEFFVKDSGIGIEKSMHFKIFERFRQAEDSTSRVYGGTGLGLAICKGFVELLDGEIRVESEIGRGSTFFFTIPYNPVKVQLNFKNEQNIDKKNLILVVEDSEFNFLYLEEILKTADYKVIHAVNGLEAIDLFMTNKQIKLILMDILMPEMNGYDAAKKIKEISPQMPIIAQTAYGLEHEIEKYSDIFDDYLVKPINADHLRQIVKKFLSHNK